MSLASKVRPIPDTVGQYWKPADMPKNFPGAPTACHFATCYWLFEAAYNRPFAWDEFLNLGNSTGFIASLLPQGRALQFSHKIHKTAGLKIESTGGPVPAGWVIVFAENPASAGHSCIMKSNVRIGGYNQTDWFSSPGVDHGYSEHPTVDIDWKGRHGKGKHRTKRFAKEYTLYGIPEHIAVQAMRAKRLV